LQLVKYAFRLSSILLHDPEVGRVRQPDWEAMQAALRNDQFERIYESGRLMTFKKAFDLAMDIVSQDRK
jgi:hypothetical protein